MKNGEVAIRLASSPFLFLRKITYSIYTAGGNRTPILRTGILRDIHYTTAA